MYSIPIGHIPEPGNAEVFPGAAAKIGVPLKKYKLLSERCWQDEMRPRGRSETASTDLRSLRTPPSALNSTLFRGVPNLKPAPQAKAPGQANRPFSLKDLGCVSLPYLYSALRGRMPRTVSLFVTVL